MVAYSFKRQFVEPIRLGTKRQTIRAHRRGRSRHARPGDTLQLYFGMRTRQCERIVPDVVCRHVSEIELDFGQIKTPAAVIVVDGVTLEMPAAATLAQADGFTSLGHMAAFWLATHGPEPFRGVLIEWEAA